jgi:hypothetical protein
MVGVQKQQQIWGEAMEAGLGEENPIHGTGFELVGCAGNRRRRWESEVGRNGGSYGYGDGYGCRGWKKMKKKKKKKTEKQAEKRREKGKKEGRRKEGGRKDRW